MSDWITTRNSLRSIAGSDWLDSRVADAIEEAASVYIACSGGADSVFLALCFSGAEWRDKITVLHFNHKLRGAESDEDERFVRNLCDCLGLDLVVGAWAHSGTEPPVTEDAAREARMQFFADALGKGIDDSIILTGHHGDDVAETLLMRLSRGSGLQGLCAPRALSTGSGGLRFARPLLTLQKDELIGWLRKANSTWREDESNRSSRHYRNRLRKKVIPEWEIASERPIHPGVALSRRLLEEDWQALEVAFEAAWAEIGDGRESLRLADLLELPRAFQRRAINRFVLDAVGSPVALPMLDSILESLVSQTPFKKSIEDSLWIEMGEDGVIRISSKRCSNRWPVQALPLNATLFFPDLGSLMACDSILGQELLEKVRAGAVSHEKQVYLGIEEKQRPALQVRLWEPGDAYQPVGRKSPVKLKELFIDRKIPREQRSSLPVIVHSNGDILWVPFLPPNQNYLLTKNATRALQLTYEK